MILTTLPPTCAILRPVFRQIPFQAVAKPLCPVIPLAAGHVATPPPPTPPGVPPPEFPDFEKGIREFVKALVKSLGLSFESERGGRA